MATIELSFLNRFDSLDKDVRQVLQTCAVLGMSFAFSDVVRVHMDTDEVVIRSALNSAVDEMILMEDEDDEEDEDDSLIGGAVIRVGDSVIDISLKGRLQALAQKLG